MDGTLVATLPDGTGISYPRCRVESDGSLSAVKASFKPAYGEKHWPRVSLWRGLLVENVTQATCASLLREVLRDCDAVDLPVVAHVHDEVVLEVAHSDRKSAANHLQQIMEKERTWTKGLPLHAEPTIVTRYGK